MNSDENGLRWHRLTGVSSGGRATEIMAATCIDGIGVIVNWTRRRGHWDCEALDTEGQVWEAVDFEDEANIIPAAPPEIWDDLS